jgi:hypothetical protein
VDADFSSETVLELWDLDLGNQQQSELQPVASIGADSRWATAPVSTILHDILANTVSISDSTIWRGVSPMTTIAKES